jgi:hypothetical protein
MRGVDICVECFSRLALRAHTKHTGALALLLLLGAEFFIMENFPFEEYIFQVLTIERPAVQLQDLLKRNKYEFLCKLSQFGETLWVHQDTKSSLDLSVLTPARCVSKALR